MQWEGAIGRKTRGCDAGGMDGWFVVMDLDGHAAGGRAGRSHAGRRALRSFPSIWGICHYCRRRALATMQPCRP